MRALRLAGALALLLILPGLSADGQMVFNVTSATGETGDVIDLAALFDTDQDAQGWSLGLCHEAANLLLLDAVDGATTATVNNGAPPDFDQISVFPDGATQGVVICFTGCAVLPAGTGHEILITGYQITAVPDVDPIETPVCYCDTLGEPPVATVIVVQGQSIVPEQNCGLVTIIPPPDYCLELACEGGTTDATLSWNVCSPFDYFLLHRNGELIAMLDGADSSYVDPGLAPGDYQYELIGVVFPDPVGEPVILVAGCTVSIIPVTITGLTPPSGAFYGGTVVTITGTGFDAAPDTTVEFGGVTALGITVIDGTTIECTTPAATALGAVDVFVGNSAGSATLPGGFLYGFIRGEVNSDALIDIADPVYGLDYLFSGGPPPDCPDALDTNDDGLLDLADPIYLLTFLFDLAPEPPPPFPEAGLDPTADPIGCLE